MFFAKKKNALTLKTQKIERIDELSSVFYETRSVYSVCTDVCHAAAAASVVIARHDVRVQSDDGRAAHARFALDPRGGGSAKGRRRYASRTSGRHGGGGAFADFALHALCAAAAAVAVVTFCKSAVVASSYT